MDYLSGEITGQVVAYIASALMCLGSTIGLFLYILILLISQKSILVFAEFAGVFCLFALLCFAIGYSSKKNIEIVRISPLTSIHIVATQ